MSINKTRQDDHEISRRRFVKTRRRRAPPRSSVPASVRSRLRAGRRRDPRRLRQRALGSARPFSATDESVPGRAVQQALADGLQVGGKRYGVQFILRTPSPNPSRASQVTKDLINGDNVDLVHDLVDAGNGQSGGRRLRGGGHALPLDRRAVGERSISAAAPSRASRRRSNGPIISRFGVGDFAKLYADQWSKVETNKKVGVLLPNDADGNAIRGADAARTGKGRASRSSIRSVRERHRRFLGPDQCLQATKASRSSIPSRSRRISRCSGGRPRKRAWPSRSRSCSSPRPGCSSRKWKRSARLVTAWHAGAYWHRHFPFISPVTGLSCEDIADGYEKASGKPWSQQVGAQMAPARRRDRGAQAASGNPKDKAADRQGAFRR